MGRFIAVHVVLALCEAFSVSSEGASLSLSGKKKHNRKPAFRGILTNREVGEKTSSLREGNANLNVAVILPLFFH